MTERNDFCIGDRKADLLEEVQRAEILLRDTESTELTTTLLFKVRGRVDQLLQYLVADMRTEEECYREYVTQDITPEQSQQADYEGEFPIQRSLAVVKILRYVVLAAKRGGRTCLNPTEMDAVMTAIDHLKALKGNAICSFMVKEWNYVIHNPERLIQAAFQHIQAEKAS